MPLKKQHFLIHKANTAGTVGRYWKAAFPQRGGSTEHLREG
jgi:hypothetical protein